jgi:hypothetical protein
VIKPIEYKLKTSFRNRIRQQLRELVFIRLVSVLEAYLVDTVRDVFVTSKKPFKDQAIQVNFTQAEILSIDSMSYVLSKIINKECRRLTSGGFTEIMKYYRTRFEIDLTSIPPGKSAMTEYHERRHLLVHRLGKPDNQYRKTYAFTGRQVTIEESYLEACFSDFEAFIETVDRTLATWLEALDSGQRVSIQPSVSFKIVLQNDSEPAFFDEDFQFWVGDELFLLRDILKSKKYISQHECELVLAGEPEALRIYAKYLRRAEKHGHLTATGIKSVGLPKAIRGTLDEAMLSKVQQSLPAQPWPRGIHKVVAEQLGVSNGTVSDAIQALIYRGIFKQQIEGQIVEK